MNIEDENLINEITDSLYHCIDLLNLLTEEQNLDKSISLYLGPLKILKKELMSDLYYFEQFADKESF